MSYCFITGFVIIYKGFLDCGELQLIWKPACRIKWSYNLHFPLQLLIFSGKRVFYQLLELLGGEGRGGSNQALKCEHWFLDKGSISGHNLENLQALGCPVPGWDSEWKISVIVLLPRSCDLGQCFQLLCCCSLYVNKGLMCTLNFK